MSKTHRIVLAGLFAALAFIFTYFVHIPFSASGYFNIGDSFILLSAILIDPYTGILVGIVSSVLSDTLLGYMAFIPFTIVAKTIEALVAGILYQKLKGWSRYSGIVIGPLLMVLVYLVAYLILFDFNMMLVSLPFDLLQAAIASILSFTLIKIFEKSPLLNKKQ